MHSITQENTLVVGGVDSHADSHHAAALDQRGALLATKGFATTRLGYRQLLEWLLEFGEIHVIAVESTGSYAAALVRFLREHEVMVVEVNQPHAHSRRRVGKSDPIDAEMAARLFLAGRAKRVPKQTDGIVESIRLLRVARDSAVKSRSVALVQIRDLIITAPQELRDQLSCRKTLRGKANVCARFRRPANDLRCPCYAAKFAPRSTAQRIEALDREIAALDHELEHLVATAAPRTIQLLGISTGHAGQLLVTAGQNIDRLHGESSFAMLCGARPIPASSGKTVRHRLNPGGDRQANRALQLIVVVRLRYCQRTRAYAQRRAREGMSQREIMRCLKRYIAREVYSSLRADLADTHPQPRPPIATTICAATPASGSTELTLDIYRNVSVCAQADVTERGCLVIAFESAHVNLRCFIAHPASLSAQAAARAHSREHGCWLPYPRATTSSEPSTTAAPSPPVSSASTLGLSARRRVADKDHPLSLECDRVDTQVGRARRAHGGRIGCLLMQRTRQPRPPRSEAHARGPRGREAVAIARRPLRRMRFADAGSSAVRRVALRWGCSSLRLMACLS